MALEHIEYGSLASSEVMNDNFEYLDDKISLLAGDLTSATASIYSNISNINTILTEKEENLENGLSDLEDSLEQLSTDFYAKDLTPDYLKAVTVTNSSGSGTLNIDWDGWLAFDLYCLQINANYYFSIDGVKVGATASDEGDRAAGIVMVRSGSVASWNGSQSIVIKKVPFVGG